MDEGWRGPWWIPDESPGGIGDPEVWIDAMALDEYGGRDAWLARTVLAGNGGGPWIGSMLRFSQVPRGQIAREVRDPAAPGVVYMIASRRWERDVNHGRPYYVARIPGEQEAP